MGNVFPRQGDIVKIDAEPHAGIEYGGHDPEGGNIQRPVIVLSNDDYNQHAKMIVGMVVTSTKRYLDPALHKEFLDMNSGVHGKIIMWQIPNYDYAARHLKIVGHIKEKLLKELIQRAIDIFQ